MTKANSVRAVAAFSSNRLRFGHMLPRISPASSLALVALFSTTAWAESLPVAPPLTAQTMRSGGPFAPEQRLWQFKSEDLQVEIFPERQEIAAVATMRFTALATAGRLAVDLDSNFHIGAISIDGSASKAASWTNPEGRLFIDLPVVKKTGAPVTVTITYAGRPHIAVRAPWDDGMVWAKTPDGQPWIATSVQSSGCDLFWPCIDYPTYEPDYIDLHITVPAGLKALSNGVLGKVEQRPDGRTTWNWHAENPTLYTVAFAIGPYEELSGIYASRFGNNVPMHYWYPPGRTSDARALFAEFAPTLDFYEQVIGPYPFGNQKMGVVDAPFRGMEHQTLNAYGGNYAKSPDGFDKIIHHEFGHEWFDNQMTASNWDDYWLHEGFDAYMQPLYGRWRDGEAHYATMMAQYRGRIRNERALVTRTPQTSAAVYSTSTGPGNDIYLKGAWVLHTLRKLIGDKSFFDATRLLVYGRVDPKSGNFKPVMRTTADLQRIITTVTGKDYGWFFDVYLYQKYLPQIVQNRTRHGLKLRWEVAGGLPFPMPLTVDVDGRRQIVPMTNGSGRILIPANAHVIIDPDSAILMQSDAVDAFQSWTAKQTVTVPVTPKPSGP
ncbi:M1 family metallopeptidase [soil metagenome]